MGKLSESEAELRKAVATQQQLADANAAVTDFRSRLAFGRTALGILLGNMGKSSAAVAEFRQALAIAQKLVDDNPSAPPFKSRLAGILSNQGLHLVSAGKTSEAIGYYAREEAIRRKLADISSPTPADRDLLANCQTNSADALRRSGMLDMALAACERSLAVRKSLVEAHPEVLSFDFRFLVGPVRGLGSEPVLPHHRFDLRSASGRGAPGRTRYARRVALVPGGNRVRQMTGADHFRQNSSHSSRPSGNRPI